MSHHVAILNQQSCRLFVVLAVRLIARGTVNYIPRNLYGIIILQVNMEEQQQIHQFIQVVVTRFREYRPYLGQLMGSQTLLIQYICHKTP